MKRKRKPAKRTKNPAKKKPSTRGFSLPKLLPGVRRAVESSPDYTGDLFYTAKFVKYRDPRTGRFAKPNGRRNLLREILGTRIEQTKQGPKLIEERITRSYKPKKYKAVETIEQIEQQRVNRIKRSPNWTNAKVKKIAEDWDLEEEDVQERLGYTGEFYHNALDYYNSKYTKRGKLRVKVKKVRRWKPAGGWKKYREGKVEQ